jgi:hypothetical protein
MVNQNPSFSAGYVTVPDGEVENLLKVIKPDYEPAIIASSKSRIRDLALQLELAKKRSRNLNLKKNLRLVELPTAGIKDSIMTAIKNGDYAGFKSSAPSSLHSEFFNMNRDLNEMVNETKVVEPIVPIDEPIVDVSESLVQSVEEDDVIEFLDPNGALPLEEADLTQKPGYKELADIGLMPEVIAVSYKWNPQRAEGGGVRAIAKDYGVYAKLEPAYGSGKIIVLIGSVDNIKGFLEEYAFPDLDGPPWEEGIKNYNGRPIKLYELPEGDND